MVLITSAVGFVMAALQRPWAPIDALLSLSACLIGVAFSASGANALNMWYERDRDARMTRTRNRPVPSGEISPNAALGIGIGCSALGPSILCAWASPAAAVVAFATIALYVGVYTPLKPVTTLSTVVGAVPGALPPLIGFAAAYPMSGSFASLQSPAGWSLVALLAVWQIPHFLAIAWMYKDDYAAGGHRVLAAEDPTGARTSRASLLWLGALFPVSLAPIFAMPELLGWPYAVIATALNIAWVATAIGFARQPARPKAVRVFLASIAWLPLVLLAMVAEAVIRTAVV
jgi:protoheme IX farnesyltransferase